jgi:hypothetical protein
MAHLPTLFQRPDRITSPLHVVVPIYNASRYRSRWRLYEDFARQCERSGAILYTVEIAFGDRAFAVTDPQHPRHLQLRTTHELWLKERAINLGVQRFPADWRYGAYIDADTQFVRPDWADETLHQLQHYQMVQLWSQYQFLNADHELMGTNYSFAQGYLDGRNDPVLRAAYPYPVPGQRVGSPGLAWAWRREAWDLVGGLLDTCILGSADTHMAWGLIDGLTDTVVDPRFSPAYRAGIYAWQDRARALHKNVGVVKGAALHHWHGPLVARKYGRRNQILIDGQFNPETDLRPDWQGLWQLHVHDARTIQLRDQLRAYFSERNEDA